MKTFCLLPVLLLLGSFGSLEAGNILYLVSTAKHNNPGWSRPLLDALLAKGHLLTVLSSEPNPNPKKAVEGLVYFYLPNHYDVMEKHFIDKETKQYQQMVALKQLLVWYEALLGSCHSIMESSTMQKLMPELAAHTAHNFDLIITDVTQGADCLLAIPASFAYQNTPVLGLSAGKLTPGLINLLRAEHTISAARTPHHLSHVPRNMGFWNRLHNHLMFLGEPIINWLIVRPVLEKIIPSGEAFPKLQLVLLNTHPVVDYVQNLPPGVIEVGGLHIKNKVNSLPTYIDWFVDKFIDGVVYINMPYIESMCNGILAMTEMIRNNPNTGFIWNVKKLELLPTEMENLITVHVDQALQQDILAQPFVKAFLNHGDSFSVLEAVHNGVPMVVLPLYLEHFNTAYRIAERSLGILVPPHGFHLGSLSLALHLLLNDNRITDALFQAKLQFRSRPQSALDLAIWHAEKMMAEPSFFKYLAQPQVNNQNFFEAYSLDVLAVPLVFVMLFVFNFGYIIYGFLKGRSKNQENKEVKKRKKTKKVAEIEEPLNKTLMENSLVEDLNEEIIEGEIELLNKSKEENPIPEEEAEEASLPIQEEKNLEDKKQD